MQAWQKPCMPLDIFWKLGLAQHLICLSSCGIFHTFSGIIADCFAFLASRSISFYKQAAEIGDKRAAQRLKSSAPVHQPGGPGSVLNRDGPDTLSSSSSGKNAKDKDCVIM